MPDPYEQLGGMSYDSYMNQQDPYEQLGGMSYDSYMSQPQNPERSWWDTAKEMGASIAPSIVGGAVGSLVGPWGTIAGAALGSGAGELWRQDIAGEPTNLPLAALETGIGAIPFGKQTAGLMGAIKYGAKSGLGQSLVSTIPRHLITTGELPTMGQAGTEALFGTAFGGATGGAMHFLPQSKAPNLIDPRSDIPPNLKLIGSGTTVPVEAAPPPPVEGAPPITSKHPTVDVSINDPARMAELKSQGYVFVGVNENTARFIRPDLVDKTPTQTPPNPIQDTRVNPEREESIFLTMKQIQDEFGHPVTARERGDIVSYTDPVTGRTGWIRARPAQPPNIEEPPIESYDNERLLRGETPFGSANQPVRRNETLDSLGFKTTDQVKPLDLSEQLAKELQDVPPLDIPLSEGEVEAKYGMSIDQAVHEGIVERVVQGGEVGYIEVQGDLGIDIGGFRHIGDEPRGGSANETPSEYEIRQYLARMLGREPTAEEVQRAVDRQARTGEFTGRIAPFPPPEILAMRGDDLGNVPRPPTQAELDISRAGRDAEDLADIQNGIDPNRQPSFLRPGEGEPSNWNKTLEELEAEGALAPGGRYDPMRNYIGEAVPGIDKPRPQPNQGELPFGPFGGTSMRGLPDDVDFLMRQMQNPSAPQGRQPTQQKLPGGYDTFGGIRKIDPETGKPYQGGAANERGPEWFNHPDRIGAITDSKQALAVNEYWHNKSMEAFDRGDRINADVYHNLANLAGERHAHLVDTGEKLRSPNEFSLDKNHIFRQDLRNISNERLQAELDALGVQPHDDPEVIRRIKAVEDEMDRRHNVADSIAPGDARRFWQLKEMVDSNVNMTDKEVKDYNRLIRYQTIKGFLPEHYLPITNKDEAIRSLTSAWKAKPRLSDNVMEAVINKARPFLDDADVDNLIKDLSPTKTSTGNMPRSIEEAQAHADDAFGRADQLIEDGGVDDAHKVIHDEAQRLNKAGYANQAKELVDDWNAHVDQFFAKEDGTRASKLEDLTEQLNDALESKGATPSPSIVLDILRHINSAKDTGEALRNLSDIRSYVDSATTPTQKEIFEDIYKRAFAKYHETIASAPKSLEDVGNTRSAEFDMMIRAANIGKKSSSELPEDFEDEFSRSFKNWERQQNEPYARGQLDLPLGAYEPGTSGGTAPRPRNELGQFISAMDAAKQQDLPGIVSPTGIKAKPETIVTPEIKGGVDAPRVGDPPIQPPGNVPPNQVPPGSRPPVPDQPPASAKKTPKSDKSVWEQAYDAVRNLTTGLDISAPMRQGLPLIATKSWWTSWGTMLKAWGSQAAYDANLKSINDHYLFQSYTLPDGKVLKGFGQRMGLRIDEIADVEEVTASKLLEQYIPGIRQSNRSYNAYLKKLRADTFTNLIEDAKRISETTGKVNNPFTDETLAREIAEFVNTATGAASLKMGVPSVMSRKGQWSFEQSAKQLSYVLFSPRQTFSRARMLNPYTYTQAPPYVRKQYMKAMIASVGAWSTIAGLAKLSGYADEVSLDPTSADFGKIRVGKTRLDAGGGFQQYLVATARLLSGQRTTAASGGGKGNTQVLGEGYQARTGLDVAQMFLSNKLHPLTKFGYDFLAASEYQPFQVGDKIAQIAIPLYMQDAYEIITQDRPEILPLLFPAAIGMGTQTYEAGEATSRIVPPKYDYKYTGGERPFSDLYRK